MSFNYRCLKVYLITKVKGHSVGYITFTVGFYPRMERIADNILMCIYFFEGIIERIISRFLFGHFLEVILF